MPPGSTLGRLLHTLQFALSLATLLLSASPSGAQTAPLVARSLIETAPTDIRAQADRLALSIILLAEHGRLLPPTAAPTPDLASLLDARNEPAATLAQGLVTSLPLADTRSFDGHNLAGGNFAAFDQLIGMDGLPVAFDRQLPTLLIPLKEPEAAALQKLADQFQSREDSKRVMARTDRLLQAPVAADLVADGCLMRPYAGRLDDLFFHLFQEGSREGRLNFYALLETLPERTYHPATGIGAASNVPPLWFSLSDLLSGGGLAAVQTYSTQNPSARIRNPFAGIAIQLLPLLSTASLNPGDTLQVSRDMMRHAVENRRKLTAPNVPTLFRDPSRFLGAQPPQWLPVKNSPTSEDPPLPELDPSANEAFRAGPAPDPAEPNPLLPNGPSSSGRTAGPQPPPSSTTPPPTNTQDPRDIIRRPGFTVAVLLPTVELAEQYVQSLAANDGALSENARLSNRCRCTLAWLAELDQLVSKSLPEPRTAAASNAIQRAAAELARLRSETDTLRAERLTLLDQRAVLQRRLEQQLRTERTAQFKRLTGAPL